jgi:hypothetical protein
VAQIAFALVIGPDDEPNSVDGALLRWAATPQAQGLLATAMARGHGRVE